jgi:protein-S-isoprenylcysteine O-methyltransferase Ste14/DNA-binding MarR family transcriptional regulator
MTSVSQTWIESVWSLVGIYWLITALWSKRVVRRQSQPSWLLHIVIMVLAGLLLFSPSAGIGVLGARFLPRSAPIEWLGFCLILIGCGFAVWARFWLGSNWSATAAVKEGHTLIQSGPYALVRHPVYAGFLLAGLGTAVAVGEIRGLVGAALAFVGWFIKGRAEERLLEEQFGETYDRLLPPGQTIYSLHRLIMAKKHDLAVLAQQMDRDLRTIRERIRRPLEAQITSGNLTGPQLSVMRALVQSEGMSLKNLSDHLGLAHSTVSGIVDRLQAQGMVERETNATDKRISRIIVTEVVRKFVRETMPGLSIHPLVQALATIDPAEQRAIARALRLLRQALEKS